MSDYNRNIYLDIPEFYPSGQGVGKSLCLTGSRFTADDTCSFG